MLPGCRPGSLWSITYSTVSRVRQTVKLVSRSKPRGRRELSALNREKLFSDENALGGSIVENLKLM